MQPGPRQNKLLAMLLSGLVLVAAGSARSQTTGLDGHGGPVMALAVSPDGTELASGSFDYAAGLWTLKDRTHDAWLDGHEAAVNVVLHADKTTLVTGSDDFTVLIWDKRTGEIRHRLQGHDNKVMGLALSRDGHILATASWDRTIRLWDLQTGSHLATLSGHQAGVNAVAFIQNDTQLLSVGADGTLRLWDVETGALKRIVRSHGFGINELLVAPDETWIAYGAIDGVVRIMDLERDVDLADLSGERRPVLALARSPDGERLAIGDGEGYIMIVETQDWRVERDFRAMARGPVWALAFAGPDHLYSGGLDDRILSWDLSSSTSLAAAGETDRRFHKDPDAMDNGERQFARKCSICHTLSGDTARRAGPALEGLFGRPAGAVEGYPYSDAIRYSDIVWSEETIDALFDIGPEHYTPGTKMPMQRITDPKDRADLIAYLKVATAPGEN